jgi:phosphoribosylpyrophosphate synthetase
MMQASGFDRVITIDLHSFEDEWPVQSQRNADQRYESPVVAENLFLGF